MRVIFNGRRKTGRLGLEAIEMAVRSAMHHAGAAALSELLKFPAPTFDQRRLPCPCGHQAHCRELRSKPVLTALGKVKVSRPYYLCPHCQAGQFPTGVELDIQDTEFSPGVRRVRAGAGQEAPFDHGRRQIELPAGLEVTTKAVERTAEAIGEDIAAREREQIQRAVQLDLPMVLGDPIPFLYVEMDGTGVPVVKKETTGRSGKTEGRPAHTREVKLGCVFTQTKWDQEGHAIRDIDSTTYTGAIETAGEFGKRLYLEAWKRGWSRAEKKVFMGDGAEWIWNIANQHFPGAIQIVDLFHARQHLRELARKPYSNQDAGQRRWMMIHQDLLDQGIIEDLVLGSGVKTTISGLVRLQAADLAEYAVGHVSQHRRLPESEDRTDSLVGPEVQIGEMEDLDRLRACQEREQQGDQNDVIPDHCRLKELYIRKR